MQPLALNQLKSQPFLQINQSNNPYFTVAFQSFKTDNEDSFFSEIIE